MKKIIRVLVCLIVLVVGFFMWKVINQKTSNSRPSDEEVNIQTEPEIIITEPEEKSVSDENIIIDDDDSEQLKTKNQNLEANETPVVLEGDLEEQEKEKEVQELNSNTSEEHVSAEQLSDDNSLPIIIDDDE